MSCLFLLFSHELTDAQQADALRSLMVSRIITPPTALREIWQQVPPDLPELGAYLEPIRHWLAKEARSGEFVLIQGDFGAVVHLVNAAFALGLTPVYSTTAREAVEEHGADGSVRLTHTFRHVRFRRYERRFIFSR